MLVGRIATEAGVGDDADLAVFVDRVAAAGSDRSTARAKEGIRRAIAAGETPPGVRRLAEALAASVIGRSAADSLARLAAPVLSSPASEARDSAAAVVAAVADTSLVVLEDFDVPAVAAAVAGLLADGRRVVVTAEQAAELIRLRAAMGPAQTDRIVDDLALLPPADIRELRCLLATSTPGRRARGGQWLPPVELLPSTEEVGRLCRLAARPTAGAGPATEMINEVLQGLDSARREAVTSVARYVRRALAALPSWTESPWVWRLLADLTYQRHRAPFDQLREETVQAVVALERANTQVPVAVTGPLPGDALGMLGRYAEYLAGGGRTHLPLRRTAPQREIQPVLRVLRVDGHTPESLGDVSRAIEYLELGERLSRIDRACIAIGIAAPRDEAELASLTDLLARVAAAARAVGALRHDVLFLAEDSPLAVPDLDTAGQVAAAIVHHAEHGVDAGATQQLDRLTAALCDTVPIAERCAEHEDALRALAVRDATAYGVAADALRAAARARHDEERQLALLDRLAAVAPRLATSWEWLARTEPAALGFVCLQPVETLLDTAPPPDSVDVVLVLGAERLGMERLLLTAVAPRLVAVVTPGAAIEDASTLLGVLHRAAAPVIPGPRSAPLARVVPMPSPRSAPGHADQGHVHQSQVVQAALPFRQVGT